MLCPVLFLGLPEIVLRLLWSPPIVDSPPAVGSHAFQDWLANLSIRGQDPRLLYVEDSQLLWRLRPNATLVGRNFFHAKTIEHIPIRITINSEGYRGPLIPLEPQAGELRVLCMGDSNFFGFPLDDADTFPISLQKSLNRDRPDFSWTVINGGTPGYSVVQGWQWYKSEFERYRPDVILLSYLNNDAWIQAKRDSGQLAEARSFWRRLNLLSRRSRFVCWLESGQGKGAIQPEHPTPRVPLEEYRDYYMRFFASAQQLNARVIIMNYRGSDEYKPYSDALEEIARGQSAPDLDVRSITFQALNKSLHATRYANQYKRVLSRWGEEMLKDKPHLIYYAEPQPQHLNEVGTALMGDVVAETVLRELRAPAHLVPDSAVATSGKR